MCRAMCKVYSSSDSLSYSHSDSELSSLLTKPRLFSLARSFTFVSVTGGERGGGGGRNEGGGGNLMLADTDTQLEEDVSPLRRTAGLISSRLGISLVAITGSGFA